MLWQVATIFPPWSLISARRFLKSSADLFASLMRISGQWMWTISQENISSLQNVEIPNAISMLGSSSFKRLARTATNGFGNFSLLIAK